MAARTPRSDSPEANSQSLTAREHSVPRMQVVASDSVSSPASHCATARSIAPRTSTGSPPATWIAAETRSTRLRSTGEGHAAAMVMAAAHASFACTRSPADTAEPARSQNATALACGLVSWNADTAAKSPAARGESPSNVSTMTPWHVAIWVRLNSLTLELRIRSVAMDMQRSSPRAICPRSQRYVGRPGGRPSSSGRALGTPPPSREPEPAATTRATTGSM